MRDGDATTNGGRSELFAPPNAPKNRPIIKPGSPRKFESDPGQRRVFSLCRKVKSNIFF
ncbi:hypothetical protein SF83666_b65450 (plasmid) [Sinorhizobium fredii CCBAU 83666]|nr:hypothetical protein SF83666_b65450 [Sinorhizobium fredii CCBAU 83666]